MLLGHAQRMYRFKPSQCKDSEISCFGVKEPSDQSLIGTLNQDSGCLNEELQAELQGTVTTNGCDFLIIAHLTPEEEIKWDLRVRKTFKDDFATHYSPSPNQEAMDGVWFNHEQRTNQAGEIGEFIETPHFKFTYEGKLVTKVVNEGEKSSIPLVTGNDTSDDPYIHFYYTSAAVLYFYDPKTEKNYSTTDLVNQKNYHKLEVLTKEGNFVVTMGPVKFFGSEDRQPPSTGPGSGHGTKTGKDGEENSKGIWIALIVFVVLLLIVLLIDIILLLCLCAQNRKEKEPIRE